MHTWATQMPAGMRLKSEGFASSLSHPDGIFTLADYCKEKNIKYADIGVPVTIETFISYGQEFQRRFVPELEDKQVVGVSRTSSGFDVTLDNGEVIACSRVVVASGIGHFSYIPPELSGLSENLITHSSRYSGVQQFKDQDVIVVGAGASALDIAEVLYLEGARVQLVARAKTIRFHDPPRPRSFMDDYRSPMTGVGAGWKLYFYVNTPGLFYRLPEDLRLKIVKNTLGPAPGWFVRQNTDGKFPFHLGVQIVKAEPRGDRVALELADSDGNKSTVEADHVIAATGFRVDLERLNFLRGGLSQEIKCFERSPILSKKFESSVPGLYFVGTAAAYSFGPMMRFAFGAEYTAKKLTRYLYRTRNKKLVLNDSPEKEVVMQGRADKKEMLAETVNSGRSV
jgi:thioredoxin reductase